ncbi:hypothetical protein ABI59_13930 [Acidobacteria bacterium Mor1]|nr:hypothetical protein ABI59_13930 [Acidobacteria bacterium Mor1]
MPFRPARRLFVCLLAVLLVSSVAMAQEAIRVADEVEERIETPHPYAGTGPSTGPVWEHVLHWPDASFISVHFERFELAEGDVLVLESGDGKQRHQYDGRGYLAKGGNFWGLSVFGDTMRLSLYSRQVDSDAYGIVIDRWTHGYPEGDVPGVDALCGSEDFEDIECYRDTHPDEFEKSRAVVKLLQNGSSHCSGWLISCENHIITNEHCVGSQAQLDNIEFQFEYKRPGCGTGTATAELQLQGGTLLEVDAGLDYALIAPNLGGNDPQATYGYIQIETELPQPNDPMYILHHPSGDPKRMSFFSTDSTDESGRCEVFSTSEPACTGASVPDVGYFCDTEGGSSGSVVMGGDDHRAIALHHCANCPNRGVATRYIYEDLLASSNPLPACSTCNPGPEPTGLAATTPSDNVIRLTWNPEPGAATYNIYRSQEEGCDVRMTQIGSTTATTFDDTSVSGDFEYSYRVSAVSAENCETALSNCATATATGVCREAPTFSGIVSARSMQSGSCGVRLDWDAASGNCGIGVRYNVYRSTSDPSAPQLIASCVEATGYVDTDVQNGIDYFYEVRAEDGLATGGGPCNGGNFEQNGVQLDASPAGPDFVFFSEDFESPSGWNLEGEWQIGVPQSLGGSAGSGSGNADPAGAYEGSQVLGTDLSGQGSAIGNYENSIAAPGHMATSPFFSAADRNDAIIRFKRWLGVERSIYDQAFVEVGDNGSWTRIWQNPDTSFSDSSWQDIELDASAELVGVNNAQIRFGIDTDGSVRYCGWNVDGLEVFERSTCSPASLGVSPVPDGFLAGGTMMTATPGAGDSVDITFDTGTCPATGFHLLYGSSDDYGAVTGSSCDVGTSGSINVSIPVPPVGKVTWWVLAAGEGSVESHHGFDSGGNLRLSEGAGHCGIETQDVAGTCP